MVSVWLVRMRVRVKMRVASNQSYRDYRDYRDQWNILEQITSVVYRCVILFGILVRDTATEKYVTRILLVQKFKQSIKWTTKETNNNKYVWLLQSQETPLEVCFS